MESGMVWGPKAINAFFRGNLIRGALLTWGLFGDLVRRCLKQHP